MALMRSIMNPSYSVCLNLSASPNPNLVSTWLNHRAHTHRKQGNMTAAIVC